MLYLITSNNYMKIGHTNNIQTRMREYSTHNPNYELICISEGDLNDEKLWHKKYALPKTEWGLINLLVINEFVKKAYLQDFYFNTDLKSLVSDSFIPTLVKQYENSTEENKWIMLELASRLKTGKCLKIINNELIWDVEKTPSLYLYIHNLIQKLPYKPIPESKRIILEDRLEPKTGLEWINKVLNFTKEYTYQELETIFKPLFEQHNLKWNKNNSIKLYFPTHTSKRKTINKKKKHIIYLTNINL